MSGVRVPFSSVLVFGTNQIVGQRGENNDLVRISENDAEKIVNFNVSRSEKSSMFKNFAKMQNPSEFQAARTLCSRSTSE